jgi:aryl-alcohol dehydrogenase-like predicted oxidoreductase
MLIKREEDIVKYLDIKSGKDILTVSKIALGTDYFGTTVSEETAFRMLDMYVDAGGNCIDTARIYASWLTGGDGASERTIGKWLKTRGGRNRVLLSTKGGHPPLAQMNRGRLSRREIEADLDESLKMLGTDVIDLYWLHRDDVSHPVEDILETMSVLAGKGKIRAFGCSNWKTERIEEANRKAGRMNSSGPAGSNAPDVPTASTAPSGFCASQIQWSLASSMPELHGDPTIVCMNEKEYDWYEREKFPVFAFSSQAKGFFARASAKGLGAINKKADARFATPENIVRLERVKEYAARSGLTPSAVALGYITCNPVPAVAIIGCKNEEQLTDSLTASDAELSREDTNWLLRG